MEQERGGGVMSIGGYSKDDLIGEYNKLKIKCAELEKEIADREHNEQQTMRTCIEMQDKLRGIYAGMQSNRTSYLQVMREIEEVV